MDLQRILALIALDTILIAVLGVIAPLYVYPRIFSYLGIDELSKPRIAITTLSFGRLRLPFVSGKYSIFFVGNLVSMISAAVYLHLRQRYKTMTIVREGMLQLIPMLNSFVRTGTPLIQALENAASMLREPLSSYVRRFTALIKLGEDPFRAMRECFPRYVAPEARLLASSIVIAMTSGGRVAEVLEEATRYVYQLQRMDYLMKFRLAEHRFIALSAVLAFALSSIVVTWLVSSIAKLSTTMPTAITVNIDKVLSCYFLSTMMLLIASSIVVSRLTTGTFLLAPRYIAMLALPISMLFVLYDRILSLLSPGS